MRRSLILPCLIAGLAAISILVIRSSHAARPAAVPQARISPAKVDLVLRQSDFHSVNYAGAGHNRVIVQGMPVATVPSSDCDGPSGGRFPIQNVFVVDESNTYITDVVVCSSSALAPGTSLSPIGPAEEHAGNVRIPFEQE